MDMLFAAEAATSIDAADTAWVMICAALVMLMIPGCALFYAGMTRSHNAVALLGQALASVGVVTVTWLLLGFTLAFGPGGGPLLGSFDLIGLAGVGQSVPGLDLTIPGGLFVLFQLMFAALTPVLLTGATADRIKFSGFLVFVAAWSLLVYAPVAHWVWSADGWIFRLGAIDFAGGTVVHINAGVAGLALAVLLGKRAGLGSAPMRPHNLPLVFLGAALLWFGWFGFNGGSALGASLSAAHALLTTQAAAATGVLGWMLCEWKRHGRPSMVGGASGALAGLVAITPACASVSVLGALLLGLLAGAAGAIAVGLKHRMRVDDALDVAAVHLVAGVLGSVAIGVLADPATGATAGLAYGGGFGLLGVQSLATVAVLAFSFTATLALGWVISKTIGLRVTDEQELVGLDVSCHGESAYDLTRPASVEPLR